MGPPLELPLSRPDGQALSLTGLRGQPVLLLFFATYDTASQLAWAPLIRALNEDQDDTLQVVGVALQPEAPELLPMYARSLGLDFPLVYDPEGQLLSGETPLGTLQAIPLYVLLNEEGQEIARHQGALLGDELAEFLAQAR